MAATCLTGIGDATALARVGLRIKTELTAKGNPASANAMYKRIFDLMNSVDAWDKLTGLAAIESLIDGDSSGENDSMRINRFANYIRIALPGQMEPDVCLAASRVMGKLIKWAGSLAPDVVELEFSRALEWLQGDRLENRRYSAVLIIRELAANSPGVMYSYLQQILDLIWTALRDPKLQVRETAAEALGVCLKIMVQRDSHQQTQWYMKVYAEACKGILTVSKGPVVPDALHGSLLALREMLRHAVKFMENRYPEASELILRNRDSKDTLIRKTVIALCSALASFNPTSFLSIHFNTYLPYLLGQLRREKDIPTVNRAFMSFGEIAVVVGFEITRYLEVFLKIVKESLAKSRSRSNDSAIFQSIGNVAKAVGPALTKHMHEILDVLFALGLTESFCRLLTDLCLCIPPLRATIQDRLLDLLSLILCGEKYQHLALVKKLPRDFFIVESRDSDIILLALNALGSFDFSDHSLLELVREVAALYLYDESAVIRKSAALTCCNLISRDAVNYLMTDYATKLVDGVFERLLVVGITDLDYRIRRAIISALDSKLDRRLIQPNNIQSIFAALNDEDFQIREFAIVVIGRLSLRHSAGVMPLLRQAFIQFLTEIQYSGVSLQTEESAKLLAGLIASSHHLVKPYVPSILKVILPKTKDPNPNIASKMIMIVCELSRYGNTDLLPNIDEILDVLVDSIKDQASTVRREAALRTLGQLATNVGIAVEPYRKYPELLSLLIAKVKSEQSTVLRRETVNVLGLLGALDPYRHRVEAESKIAVSDSNFQSIPAGTASEEYYQSVAVDALLTILEDLSLVPYHSASVLVIIQIFEKSRIKSVPLLPKVMPALLTAMKKCSPKELEFYVTRLGELTTVVQRHIRPYLSELFGVIKEYWGVSANFQLSTLSLLESIAGALQSDLKVFLPSLLPQILRIFEQDTSMDKIPTQKVLDALVAFDSGINEHLHLVLPLIVKLFENVNLPMGLRKSAIEVAGVLSKNVKFNQSSRIIHPLIRVINGPHNDLKVPAMDTLSILAIKLGPDFTVFIPMINKIISRNNIHHNRYNSLVDKILKNEKLPEMPSTAKEKPVETPKDEKAHEMQQMQLKRAWEVANKCTKEDWSEWMRKLNLEFLKESPQAYLRMCANLAAYYPPLARSLFNPAFVSCWPKLYYQIQDDLIGAVRVAINSTEFPPEILQTWLNLAEFMQRDREEDTLPIPKSTLGVYASRSHSWAKALYYKELEFLADPSPENIESLISIYNQLQQPDSAIGILRKADEIHNVQLVSSWYEKLNRWEAALEAYEVQHAEDPSSFEALHGRMRCLERLEEWESLADLAQVSWVSASEETKKIIAPAAAAAAWGIGEWNLMEQYVKMIPSESSDGAYCRAILSIHRNLYPQASYYIEKAREMVDAELMAVLGENYSRAYKSIVKIQCLVELDEVIKYKQLYEFPERQKIIRDMWMERLKGCQRDADVWAPIIRLRQLVISPKVEPAMWIKFAKICRRTKRSGRLSFRALSTVVNTESRDLGIIDLERNPPNIIFACLLHVWESTAREGEEHAFEQLRKFTKSLACKIEAYSPDECSSTKDDLKRLLGKCYLRLGQWQLYLRQYDLDESSISEMQQSFEFAAQSRKGWYKAWNEWSVAYTMIIKHYERLNAEPEVLTRYVVPAITSVLQSIALSKGSSLQDTLRLLTIWFKYGHEPEVNQAVAEGCNFVSIDTWLQVIPQLIARIHTQNPDVQKVVHKLLADVGKEHPQALVYSLTVASKSQNEGRKSAAIAIMDKMRVQNGTLIDQVLLVSEELIRVAILWQELWHEALEEASRYYYSESDIEGMFSVLEPLHKLLEKGPETLREISFHQAYGRYLLEALDWCNRFKVSKDLNDINQAWDLYYKVWYNNEKQIKNITTLDLRYVSPKLLAATDLELAVPGTYKSGDPIVRISSFDAILKVMSSKARPRRLSIKGDDGFEYQYLLKGHDDMRQDERVMQLFGLVNTFLKTDPETFQRQLSIRKYSVTPLSEISGLIGWVPNCDTIQALVKDYRDSRKIILNIEQKLMSEIAPMNGNGLSEYDKLTLGQKVEVFEYALNKTDGKDLMKMLWLRSKNSEIWLDRRTTYTRSLAVMSMVGYILGLGDRHPANLMIDRFTGKVVHIDFGDCFEVAMQRDKYPEKIPFRLTRMLINAMEVSGIEGNFRITCENVMRVLRSNRGSVLAVLEAFVHDPLINWRLMAPGSPKLEGKKNVIDESDLLENQGMNELQSGRYYGDGSKKFKSLKIHETVSGDDQDFKPEALNERAVSIVQRVTDKLSGTDFKNSVPLDDASQVNRLILQATSTENLCQCYVGWCAFW